MKRYLSLLLLFVFPLLAGAAEEAPKRLRVLATFGPIYSLTANVAGGAADVEQFLPPGGDPHHFALSPRDIKRLQAADVIVENGLRLEDWLTRAMRHSKALRVTASKGIRTDDGNPHVWLDPQLAIVQVENIAAALSKRDPANAATYQRNAKAYIARLRKLDAEIAKATGRLRDKRLMTAHSAFHYFAKRYGFEVVGTFGELPGHEPTARELRRLRGIIKESNIRVLFAEPGHSPKVMKSLSKELGIPVIMIDPMEGSEPSAEMYEKVMRYNLRQLKEGLGG